MIAATPSSASSGRHAQSADRTNRPPADPVGSFPRRIPGRGPDGRRWELLTDSAGVTAAVSSGTALEAHVTEHGEQVVIEFEGNSAALPLEAQVQLVEQTFAHPAVRPHRPVIASVPRRDTDVLRQVRTRLADAHTHVAGVTCLVEGRIGE